MPQTGDVTAMELNIATVLNGRRHPVGGPQLGGEPVGHGTLHLPAESGPWTYDPRTAFSLKGQSSCSSGNKFAKLQETANGTDRPDRVPDIGAFEAHRSCDGMSIAEAC